WIGRPDGLLTRPEIIRRLLIDFANKAIPENAPAEPYWGVYEAAADGTVTGNIWTLSPTEIVLFENRRDAERMAKHIAPPSGELSLLDQKGVGWAIRGVSKEHLSILKTHPTAKLFAGTISQNGELLVRPIV